MNPLFTYFGGKWRLAPKYPKPEYDTIIEPFAGSAGYSVRHYQHKVKLFDLDERIVGTRQYLINVSEEEILSLPVNIQHVDEINGPQEQKLVVGWWFGKGNTAPAKTPCKWLRDGLRPNSFWGPVIRQRIADSLKNIRHWTYELKSYESIDNEKATWFIDPPYQGAGRFYRKSQIDFNALSVFCRSRQGQTMVCENVGADWLPFQAHTVGKGLESKTRTGVTHEALWENRN